LTATITGGTGFVGRHLVDLLNREHVSVTVVSNEPNVDPHGPFYCAADITHEAQIAAAFAQRNPTHVYHLAAISTLSEAAREVRLAFEVNVWGTRNVLEASSRLPGPPRVLNVSSSQVYGPVNRQIDESTPVAPTSIYGSTKAMSEVWASLYSPRLEVITARSFNHTGPGQTDAFVLPHLARSLAEIEAGLRPPALHTGNLNVERDFTDVRDVVKAYLVLMQRGHAGHIYNVCSGKYYRISDLLDILLGLAKVKVSVAVDKSRCRANDIPRIWGDHSKLTEHTGWRPSIPIEQTLQDMLSCWRAHIRDSAQAPA